MLKLPKISDIPADGIIPSFWKAIGRFFKILLVVGKKTPSFREAFRAYQRDPELRKESRMKGCGSVVAVGEAFQKHRRAF